jgi:hypothetical protein
LHVERVFGGPFHHDGRGRAGGGAAQRRHCEEQGCLSHGFERIQ